MSAEQTSAKRPFRDSALLYAAMAIVFVVLVFITGGKWPLRFPSPSAVFVVATGYAWWKLKQRLEEEQRREREQEAS